MNCAGSKTPKRTAVDLEPSFKELSCSICALGRLSDREAIANAKCKLAIAKRLRQKIDCEASAEIAEATENKASENSE